MGRGRAKAKQTKVARELKYRSVSTDFTSLERELRGDGTYEEAVAVEVVEETPEEPDPYADLAARYELPDDDEDVRRSG